MIYFFLVSNTLLKSSSSTELLQRVRLGTNFYWSFSSLSCQLLYNKRHNLHFYLTTCHQNTIIYIFQCNPVYVFIKKNKTLSEMWLLVEFHCCHKALFISFKICIELVLWGPYAHISVVTTLLLTDFRPSHFQTENDWPAWL